MTIDRALQLLNAELDGELSASDRVELQELLAARPELHTQREALRDLTRCLQRAADLEPPPGMTQRLLSSIRLPVRRRMSWSLPRWQLNPRALPFAALATALMVAVGSYWSLPPNSMVGDSAAMVGSMVRDQSQAGMELQDRLALDLDELSGEVTLATAAAGTRLLEFELASSDAVDIAISLAGSGLVFGGFSQGENSVDLIASDAATLRLRSHGERHFGVILHAPATANATGSSSIGLEFSGQQKSLFKGELKAP